jgi:myo-inositol-1(or 4)-monophosphatase
MLCALRDGRPECGVIYFPADQMMITAERGKGCFVNGHRVRLSWDRPLDKTMVGTDIGPWTAYDVLSGITAQGFVVRSIMAAAYGFRAVLLKETGMYYNLGVAKVWDAAVGVLAVEEAGGVAFAPDGSPLRWNTIAMDWVAAANNELAEHVLRHTKTWPGR